jgi:hypothetical protein
MHYSTLVVDATKKAIKETGKLIMNNPKIKGEILKKTIIRRIHLIYTLKQLNGIETNVDFKEN